MRLQIDQRAVAWREVEGQIVALDLDDDMYLAVNEAGAVLWPLLVEGADRPELVDALTDTFDIDRERASQDVERFVADLQARGLLVEEEDT